MNAGRTTVGKERGSDMKRDRESYREKRKKPGVFTAEKGGEKKRFERI